MNHPEVHAWAAAELERLRREPAVSFKSSWLKDFTKDGFMDQAELLVAVERGDPKAIGTSSLNKLHGGRCRNPYISQQRALPHLEVRVALASSCRHLAPPLPACLDWDLTRHLMLMGFGLFRFRHAV